MEGRGITHRLDELILRFAFMDGAIPRSATLRFLLRLEEELAAHLEELASFLPKARPAMGVSTGLLAIESEYQGYKASLA